MTMEPGPPLPSFQQTAYQTAAAWLSGQSFNNVLLLSILVAIGAGGWYGIPAAINQIHTGHKDAVDKFREEAGAQRAVFEKMTLLQREAYERSSDREYSTTRTLLEREGIKLPPMEVRAKSGTK